MRFASLLAAASALAAVHAVSAPAAAQSSPSATQPGFIEVGGEASVEAAPDFATVTLGVTTAGKDAGEATAANAKAVNALIAALKGDGVAAADIQTSSFSISPSFSNPPQGSSMAPAIVGYSVGNMVTVKVRDLARVGALLDKAVGSGANAMYGVEFGKDNISELLDKARPLAVADAKRKADIYAAAAGVRVGRLVELSEETAAAPQPFPRRYASVAKAAAPTPIEPGQDKVTLAISARFEIIQ